MNANSVVYPWVSKPLKHSSSSSCTEYGPRVEAAAHVDDNWFENSTVILSTLSN